jgi:transposase
MDLKKRRGHITAELREMALRLLETGEVTQKQLAEEINVSERTLRKWRVAAREQHESEPLTPAERTELEELRRENRRLKEHAEIQKKFQAFVAKEEKQHTASSKRRRRR